MSDIYDAIERGKKVLAEQKKMREIQRASESDLFAAVRRNNDKPVEDKKRIRSVMDEQVRQFLMGGGVIIQIAEDVSSNQNGDV